MDINLKSPTVTAWIETKQSILFVRVVSRIPDAIKAAKFERKQKDFPGRLP